jgi:hypothetical protein
LLKKLHREIAEACNQIAGLMLAQDTACPWGGAFRTEYFRDRTPFLLEQMPEKTAAGTGIIFVLGHAWPEAALQCARNPDDGGAIDAADGRKKPVEPEKPTAIPHLEGKGVESFLEESGGNRVYTRRRGKTFSVTVIP